MGLRDLLCRNRDLQKTLDQSRARLYRVAYAWTHNAALADDLVQETLTKAWRKAGQLRDPGAQDAWMFTILANCYRDHFRRYRPMEDVDDIELQDDRGPETENMRRETIDRVRGAVARLSEGQRQVITLVDLEEFSYVEVAQILSVPIGTAMSRLCRARAALKEMLLADMQEAAKQEAIRRIK